MMKANIQSPDRPVDVARIQEAVAEVVRKQADIGIDVVDDGEFSKPSFVTYVRDRLGGHAPTSAAIASIRGTSSRDALAFPGFLPQEQMARRVARQPRIRLHQVRSRYKGSAQLKTDLDNLKAAMAGRKAAEAFVPSISLANIESWNVNQFYKTDEEYLHRDLRRDA